MAFRSGFVSILGRPNAGKSTLLNALVGEKMAIVSPKVQTTRHRIRAFLNADTHQIIFSDTPGIIEPKYRLQEKMMYQVKSALEDADVALLVHDLSDGEPQDAIDFFAQLKLKVPRLLVANKTDKLSAEQLQQQLAVLEQSGQFTRIIPVSALHKQGITQIVDAVVDLLPEGPPFFDTEDLSDLPTRFFVGEIIREKIFELYHSELPYHATVLVQEFSEKSTLIKIRADVVVQRETQKMIILGERGSMIKKLGTAARQDIEQFIGQKVFLELFVKVRPKWRDQDLFLREYGYE